MEKNENMKAICAVVLFVGVVAGIAHAISHYNYSGPKVDEEYCKMCDVIQACILRKQDPQGIFAANVKHELQELKKAFKLASTINRARQYTLMQGMVAAVSYNGVKVTKEEKLTLCPLREKYEFLEKQISSKWHVLSLNNMVQNKWNDMVRKVEAAEVAFKEAEQAMKDTSMALEPVETN